jgi:hypothetical protein
MIGGTLLGRRRVAEAMGGGSPPERLMVTAVPIDPFRRQVVADLGDRYQVGTYRFLARSGLEWSRTVDKGPIRSQAVGAASRSPAAAPFLHWSRVPAVRILPAGDSVLVRLYDLRYTDGEAPSFASVDLTVPGPPP